MRVLDSCRYRMGKCSSVPQFSVQSIQYESNSRTTNKDKVKCIHATTFDGHWTVRNDQSLAVVHSGTGNGKYIMMRLRENGE